MINARYFRHEQEKGIARRKARRAARRDGKTARPAEQLARPEVLIKFHTFESVKSGGFAFCFNQRLTASLQTISVFESLAHSEQRRVPGDMDAGSRYDARLHG